MKGGERLRECGLGGIPYNKLCAKKEVVPSHLFSRQYDRTIMSGGGEFKKHLEFLLSCYLSVPIVHGNPLLGRE
jgi:hypothetical protein